VDAASAWRDWPGWGGRTPGCADCEYGATWAKQAFCWGVAGCHCRGVLENRQPNWALGCNCQQCVDELAGYVAALAQWNAAHG